MGAMQFGRQRGSQQRARTGDGEERSHNEEQDEGSFWKTWQEEGKAGKGAGKEGREGRASSSDNRDGRSQGESVSTPTVGRSAEPGTFQGGRLGLARRIEGSRATPSPFISTWALGVGWMKSQP